MTNTQPNRHDMKHSTCLYSTGRCAVLSVKMCDYKCALLMICYRASITTPTGGCNILSCCHSWAYKEVTRKTCLQLTAEFYTTMAQPLKNKNKKIKKHLPECHFENIGSNFDTPFYSFSHSDASITRTHNESSDWFSTDKCGSCESHKQCYVLYTDYCNFICVHFLSAVLRAGVGEVINV